MGAHAGDSSPSSAESSFRQFDDVFLQTQTRIWLGEVLQTRLSEQISIADLLADGELLFEVSSEVWKMMLERHMDLKYKYEYEPFASRNSGRYMPYSNVDSFLKICKILGLTGIDLFSPSDVVEKKDTRKVCMCIRALSKKARSRNLSVPDFDIVTYTAAMPTDMVGYIRRSWELSDCDNSRFSPNHELRERSRQKYLNAIAGRSYDYHESDETERKVSLQSDSSATIWPYSPTSQTSCDSINSPEVSSVVQSNFFDQHSEQLDVENQIQDECIQFEQRAVFSDKLTGFRFSRHLEYDQEPDNLPSLSSLDSNITIGSLDSSAESGARTSHKSNVEDRIYVDPSLEDRASVVGDSVECSTAESNITDDCPVISAISNHESCTDDFVPLDGKDGIFDACVGVGSFRSEETMTPETILRSQYIDGDDVEVSSISSATSLSISVRNLDFDDHLDADNAFKNVWSPDSANSNSCALDEKCEEGSKSQGVVKYATPGQRLKSNNKGVVFNTRYSNNYTAGYLDHAISYDNSLHISQINSNTLDEGKRFPIGFPRWDQKGKCQIAVVRNSGGPGASSASLSPVDSNEENHQLFQIVKGDTLCLESLEPIKADNDTKVCSTTTVKSDPDIDKQPNPSLSSSCCDDVMNRRHENSNNSCNVAAESENVNEDKGENEKLRMSTVDSDGIDNPTIGTAKCKSQKIPLLKAVVKGTAVVGGMFLLLHFRKIGREKSRESRNPSHKKRNVNGEDFLLVEGQRSHRADSVYPAEKLKLGI